MIYVIDLPDRYKGRVYRIKKINIPLNRTISNCMAEYGRSQYFPLISSLPSANRLNPNFASCLLACSIRKM